LRAAARRYVESERTWKHCVARYDEVYGKVMMRRAMPAPQGMSA
jgi:hypothetical protein